MQVYIDTNSGTARPKLTVAEVNCLKRARLICLALEPYEKSNLHAELQMIVERIDDAGIVADPTCEVDE